MEMMEDLLMWTSMWGVVTALRATANWRDIDVVITVALNYWIAFAGYNGSYATSTTEHRTGNSLKQFLDACPVNVIESEVFQVW